MFNLKKWSGHLAFKRECLLGRGGGYQESTIVLRQCHCVNIFFHKISKKLKISRENVGIEKILKNVTLNLAKLSGYIIQRNLQV
jgi:hypothetical protein